MKISNLTKLVITATLLVMSCGKQESTDKKAQLDDLKKQQAEISSKIKNLEKELNMGAKLEQSAKVKPVIVTPVSLQTFSHYVEIQGKVDTDNNVSVGAEVPGTITRIYVQTGDKVTKGKVLAETDASLIRKGIEELETSLQLTKTMFEKQEKLWKDNVGTEVQYLQSKSTKESMEAKMASLKEQLRKTRITAPITGFVEEVLKKEGEMASPGFPIFRVVNLSEFKLIGELAESYVEKVSVGDEVVVFFPDLDKEIKSKISVVGGTINSINRTFTIEVRMPAGKIAVKPNMICYMKIRDFSKSKAVVVPINTVQKSSTGKYVYVANGNKTEKRIVTMDGSYGNNALITEGLVEGDNLITFGYSDLSEGQAIKY